MAAPPVGNRGQIREHHPARSARASGSARGDSGWDRPDGAGSHARMHRARLRWPTYDWPKRLHSGRWTGYRARLFCSGTEAIDGPEQSGNAGPCQAAHANLVALYCSRVGPRRGKDGLPRWSDLSRLASATGVIGGRSMHPLVAVIAPGMMGAAVGKRLVDHGLKVLTSLKGRSAETSERAKAAGMVAASDEEIAASDFILSILPPGDAVALAQRFAPALS